MSNLKGKIALVTGASRGVGKGIALELGAAGATVYITGRSTADNTTENLPGTVEGTAAEVTKQGGDGFGVRCDHTIDDDVASLFDQIRNEQGRLDILINNVWGGYEVYDGIKFSSKFWEQPIEYWERMFTAGVRAHYTASRFAAPLMIERESGLIINISSGDNEKYHSNLLYYVAKIAVDRMAFGMAQELKDHGITALSIYPGFTRTERVMAGYKGDLSVTESPHYTGRAVVALATDPDILEKSGRVFRVGELAEEYGFADIDGRTIPPFNIGNYPRPFNVK